MPIRFTCTQGHHWEDSHAAAADPEGMCPVCGELGQTLSEFAGLEAFLSEADTLAPPTVADGVDAPLEVTKVASVQRSGLPRVDGYELLEELGRGAMGVVYKAVQCKADRLVALKMLRSGPCADPQELERFRHEAQTVAGLHHPNIVHIYEVNDQDGQPFFSMEFVAGGTLAQQLAGTPLSPRQAAQLMATIADAIELAHRHGIVHRDLKPENILLHHPDDSLIHKPREANPSAAAASSSTSDLIEKAVPKITDFGVAKRLIQTSNDLTQCGAPIGTPSYMAPEQAGGLAHIGPAADVYALGAILYEALTGRPPFRAATPLDTILQVLSEEPVRPQRLQPRVPHDVETICLKCLKKEPRKRYPSARAMSLDLRRYLEGKPIHARPTPFWERGIKWAARQPTVAALIGAMIATIALSFVLVTREWRGAVSAHREAIAERGKAEQLLIRLSLDRGQALCEQGEVGRGLLWLGRALTLVPDEQPELRRAIQADLAAWRGRLRGLKHMLPHPGAIRTATFSPDGKMVLTVCGDHAARLWDSRTGNLTARLEHGHPVEAAVWSGDGKRVATGDAQGGVRLWTMTAPEQGRILEGHHGPIRALVFSPDGSTLASGSLDCTVGLWKTATGESLTPLLQHRDPVQALAFQPDSRVLLVGTGDQVRFRDAGTGKLLDRVLNCPGGEVWAVLFSPDGSTLLTSTHGQAGTEATAIQLWDPATGQVRASLPHRYWVRAVAFSRDSKMIATGSEEHTAQLWSTAIAKPVGQPLASHDWVVAVAFSPDGGTLLTGSKDQTAQLWDTATGRSLGQPLEHQGPVQAVAFHPAGRTLLTAGSDQVVRLWENGPSAKPLPTFTHQDEVMAVAFSPDGRLVLTGSGDRTARLWDRASGQTADPASGKPLPVFQHQDEVWTVAFSPDGHQVATGGKDRTVVLWDVATGQKLHTLKHEHWVRSVAFSPDGRTLLTASGDRTAGMARLWNVASGSPLGDPLEQEGVAWAGAWSPDGKTVVIASGENTARLWDVTSRRAFGETLRHQNRVVAVAFSRDGSSVLTGSTDQSARLWDAATGLPRSAQPLEHQGAVWSVAFALDDQVALTAGRGPGVRLWDLTTGTSLGPPWPHVGVVWSMAVSSDGRSVLTGGQDKSAHLWLLPTLPEGSVEQFVLWSQVLTGRELEPDGSWIRFLDAEDWRERKRRLEELGGAPAVEGGS
jgi:WD40 repeat protein/serine/threonine protein kinase